MIEVGYVGLKSLFVFFLKNQHNDTDVRCIYNTRLIDLMFPLVRLECSLGWKGLRTLNMLLDCCGTTLSETGTLSQETPNPDFLFPCRGHAWKGTAGGGGPIINSQSPLGLIYYVCARVFVT